MKERRKNSLIYLQISQNTKLKKTITFQVLRSIKNKYSRVFGKAIYLCEAGFSACTSTKATD